MYESGIAVGIYSVGVGRRVKGGIVCQSEQYIRGVVLSSWVAGSVQLGCWFCVTLHSTLVVAPASLLNLCLESFPMLIYRNITRFADAVVTSTLVYLQLTTRRLPWVQNTPVYDTKGCIMGLSRTPQDPI